MNKILDQVIRAGAEMMRQPEVTLESAPKNGVLPDAFSSTTNLPTEIHFKGRWIPVSNTEMDSAIVVDPKKGRARCLRMHKVKKGDKVVVLAGRDKGKTGEVTKVMPDQDRIYVAGVNMVKRHTRATQSDPGGIKEKEATIHVSNVAIADPKTGEPTRVGFKTNDDGRKVRFAKSSGEVIDV